MRKEDISTVRELMDYAAEHHGEKLFCRFFRGETLCEKTFREFYEDCLAVCRYIRTVDSNKMNIAFIGKTSYEYIACLTGMIFSGNTVVPFAPDITAEEASELFDEADIKMLFCEDSFKERAEKVKENYKGLEHVVSLGDWHWFDEVFRKYNSESEYASLSDVKLNADDCTLLIFTSGTTGDRKGVMLSNSNLIADNCYEDFTLNPDEISFSVLPMHHVFCYTSDVLKSSYDGSAICINGALSDLYKHMKIFEPTVMRTVPALCKSMLTRIKITEKKHPELTPRQSAELVCGRNFKKMMSGSAFLSPSIVNEFEKYGIYVRQGYGMSECSPKISVSDFSEKGKYSTGKVMAVHDIRVSDGEIQIKGPAVTKGYYKNPEATKAAFTEDGWFCTGDLGYLDGDQIYLTGRKKNLIILSNGENISPETIENRFDDYTLIKEMVAYAENDRIFAEIIPNADFAAAHGIDDIEAELEKIVDEVNEKAPSDEQIYSFKIRKTPFERTTTGKLKRTEFYYRNEAK